MEGFSLKNSPFEHLTIPKWKELMPTVSVGFSTRNGGLSIEHFNSMNLALHVHDEIETVVSNRKKLTSAIGFPFEAWTSAEQVHGNNIEIVTLDMRGKGRMEQLDNIKDADGIVTNLPDILLTSFYADCVPLFFLDPVKGVIGLAHAGWRGTVLHIAEKMIDSMKYSFHSNVDDIRVAIGPSIGPCCYEVNSQVIDPLIQSMSFIPSEAIFDKRDGHFDLDLKKTNEQILKNAGILSKHIEVSTYCTSCHSELFFSHRRDNGKTGRMASWIGIRKDE